MGMDTKEVRVKVVEVVRKQDWREVIDMLYSDDIVNIEAQWRDGESHEKRGIEAVRAKTDWWIEAMTVDGLKVTGPFVAHDRRLERIRLGHDVPSSTISASITPSSALSAPAAWSCPV